MQYTGKVYCLQEQRQGVDLPLIGLVQGDRYITDSEVHCRTFSYLPIHRDLHPLASTKCEWGIS